MYGNRQHHAGWVSSNRSGHPARTDFSAGTGVLLPLTSGGVCASPRSCGGGLNPGGGVLLDDSLDLGGRIGTFGIEYHQIIPAMGGLLPVLPLAHGSAPPTAALAHRRSSTWYRPGHRQLGTQRGRVRAVPILDCLNYAYARAA
jgi:hypothetical protein